MCSSAQKFVLEVKAQQTVHLACTSNRQHSHHTGELLCLLGTLWLVQVLSGPRLDSSCMNFIDYYNFRMD